MINKSKILMSGLLLVSILGIGLYTNVIKLPIEREIHLQFDADYANDQILMGGSHNVFAGKVIKKVGEKTKTKFPQTQFEVEVVFNIKGNLKGTVVVSQMGGYRNGILYTTLGGDVLAPNSNEAGGLLKSGTTYLFATRNTDGKGWYHLNSHPNASKVISEDGNLTVMELKTIAQNDDKIQKLQKAYKNEILLETDIKNNWTRNSYKSLQGNK